MAAHSSVACVKLTARQSLLHQLFGDHHGWLFNRLRLRLGCPSDAADMASKTFAHVVALDDPHSIRESRALLTTIAMRLMYAMTTYSPRPGRKIGRDDFVGEPGYDHFNSHIDTLGYVFEHRLSDTLKSATPCVITSPTCRGITCCRSAFRATH